MPPSTADQLQTHAKALRALARDLVGEQHADDLLQDAAVQAIVSPPRQPGPLGGWFATVLRHLASKHRRGERRRLQREQLAARREALPAADVEVAARDRFQRLCDAVLALPQPYQGVLLRRYLQEQSPREIAAATGVPVATVKSQLQRGLVLLRERFERSGSDWRAGLLEAFALRDASGPVGTGVLIMASAGKLVGLAAAVTLAVTVGWWLHVGEPAAPSAAASPTPQAPLAAANATGAKAADLSAPAAAVQRTELVAAVDLATIRGRCVDAGSAPLAGCRVTLDGMAEGGELEYWVRHHYDPQWDDPPAVHTSADGRFEFRFVPHEPLRFVLRMEMEGRVAMCACWPARTHDKGIAPGEVVDLGDVAVQAGMQARGRVVDDRGEPIVGVRVNLQAKPRAQESTTPQPADSDSPATDGNGIFAAAPLPPGQYLVSIDSGEYYVGGGPQAHDLFEPSPWLEMVLPKRAMPASVQGVVVDERGSPVAGASLSAPGINRGAWSRADGAFELFVSQDDPTALESLQIHCDGFETSILQGPFAWGSRGLRVVMSRGLDVDLLVVDAHGQPVEDFAAWIWVDRDSASGPHVYLSGDQHARAYGHHDGGKVQLKGLRRGRHRLYVEPRDASLMATEVQRIEVTEPSPMQLRVELPRVAERTVRVLDGKGAPVAGTTVELLEQALDELEPSIKAWPIEKLVSTFGGSKALVRQTSTTDARGESPLRGPAGGSFAVRVPGPNNLPAFVRDVRLDLATPLVITVQRGGALQVALRPAGVVAALRGYAGLGEKAVPVWEPRLQLWQPEEPGALPTTRQLPEVLLPNGGKVTLAGVPPGAWHLRLAACVRTSVLMVDRWHLELGDFTLRDGETATAVLDLPQLLPGELRGTALHNGAPMARARIALRGVFEPGDSDYSARYAPWRVQATTDDAGNFTATVRPGRYTVVAGIAADEVVPIAAGEHVVQTFTLRSGQLCVRYVDAEGRPVPEVGAVLRDAEHGDEAFHLAYSDARGTSTTTVAPRTFALFAERCSADGPSERLPLGDVTVLQGTTTTIERTLPAAWLRR